MKPRLIALLHDKLPDGYARREVSEAVQSLGTDAMMRMGYEEILARVERGIFERRGVRDRVPCAVASGIL